MDVGELATDDNVESNKHQIEFEKFDPHAMNFKNYVCNTSQKPNEKSANMKPLLEANVDSLVYDTLEFDEKKAIVYSY